VLSASLFGNHGTNLTADCADDSDAEGGGRGGSGNPQYFFFYANVGVRDWGALPYSHIDK
jgi:hypothetical protein